MGIERFRSLPPVADQRERDPAMDLTDRSSKGTPPQP